MLFLHFTLNAHQAFVGVCVRENFAESSFAHVSVRALTVLVRKLSRSRVYTEKDVKQTHEENYRNTRKKTSAKKCVWVREFSSKRRKCKNHKRVKSVQIEPSMWKRLDSNVARNFFCCVFSFLDLMWKVSAVFSLFTSTTKAFLLGKFNWMEKV